jgi:hypothetical protein
MEVGDVVTLTVYLVGDVVTLTVYLVGDVVTLTVYLVGAVDAVRRRSALAVFSERIAPA